jgi:hypothetical protein
MKNDQSRLTADIPKACHLKLKSIALVTGKSMREVLVEAIEAIDVACLTSDHVPNAETLRSIENIESGKGLTEIDDLRDLFKKLGIK